MIQLTRPTAIPDVLIKNGNKWTQELTDAVKHYGSYKSIPKDEKEKILVHYRHQDIKDALFASSHNKCSFCECIAGESSYLQVEHFYPKSIYFDKAFEWDNLLPACGKCNLSKSDVDTMNEPIVNPYNYNPIDYFDYASICLVPSVNSPNSDISDNTIDICNLNGPRLLQARGTLLVSLTSYEESLKAQLKKLQSPLIQDRVKRDLTNNIVNSIDMIDELIGHNKAFSGFVNNFISNSFTYQQAKSYLRLLIKDMD